MVATTFSEVTFGGVKLHQLRSGLGKVLLVASADEAHLEHPGRFSKCQIEPQVFFLAEVAIEVFQENPTVFLQARLTAHAL